MSTIASQPLVRHMTYAEFLKADFENNHVEWVDGEIVPMAPISDEHSEIDISLGAWVAAFVEHHGLGVVRREPFQMKTGPDLPGRSPDMIFVATANTKRLRKTYLQGHADLAVEIISPESRGRDRGDKFYEYEKGGVKEYWLIDPERKQADFFVRNKAGIYKAAPIAKDSIYRSSVINGLWIDVRWFWRRPLPSIVYVLKEWKLV